MATSTGLSPEFLDAALGPKCPACGWRRGQHRPGGQFLEACPDAPATARAEQ